MSEPLSSKISVEISLLPNNYVRARPQRYGNGERLWVSSLGIWEFKGKCTEENKSILRKKYCKIISRTCL